MFDLERALLSIPIFLLALTVHEFAHGYAAYRLGDRTAFNAGRLTFNPLAHIDPMGALVFVLSGFRFGWAKPVPVDLRNVGDLKRGMLQTAAAGPTSNVLQALIFGTIIRFAGYPIYILASPENDVATIIGKLMWYGVLVNLSLGFFNMLPVPPLDGSKILYGLLPRGKERIALQLEQVGPVLLIGLIAVSFFLHIPIIWTLIGPFVKIFVYLFTGQSLPW